MNSTICKSVSLTDEHGDVMMSALSGKRGEFATFKHVPMKPDPFFNLKTKINYMK